FTDIRNFTGLCESLEPGEMLKLLNQYFAVIHEEASATQGVLDKYIGDSALLFWGAPEPIDQPAQACIEAAIRCRERLDILNDQWQREGVPVSFHTTFGIDYGSVVVGNIGPRERVNFTIIGERVNLAQRLEHSNRLYGTRILASADLVQALGSSSANYLIVKVADTTLRGFSHPMEIFEVIGRRDHANAMEVRFSDTLNAAQEARHHNRLEEALALLHSLPTSLAERPYVQELIHSCNGGLG
ncbi:MAG: adenylate/guanylate cyclase domain-containing protein, partial [bacterium]